MSTAIDKGWRPEAPPLQELASPIPRIGQRGQLGLGWGLSREQLAELHARARHMRNNPTEPEMRLWRNLSNGQLHGHKFRRQSVIGWHIADFLCPKKALIVEVDGMTHEAEADRKRDFSLEQHGFRVVHVTNDDVMHNMDGVLTLITVALFRAQDRWPDSPHPNPVGLFVQSGGLDWPTPKGEGLKEVEAQKLLRISLEGSVG